MSITVERTEPITPTGVGRKDYSEMVEQSVEPLIRSYQEEFHAVLTILNVPPGGTITVDVPITSKYVAILYNFNVAVYRNVLIGLVVSAVAVDGTVAPVITENKYQRIKATLARGFPFFRTIRVAVSNYGDVALDFDFHCNGIYTSEEEYYLTI
jgi:hypothetical protein